MNPEKTSLLRRLQEAGLSTRRFLKVDDTKRAFEKEWQKNLYTPDELQDHHSWGVCGGDGLVLIDADNAEIAEALRRVLPATFEVLSSRRELPHFYFKVTDGEVQNKTLYLPETGEAAGEIRVNNQYLVSAGTITFHGVYRIIADRPIATLSYDQFMTAVKPYLGKDSSQRLTEEQIKNGVSEGERHNIGIKTANFIVGKLDCDYNSALTAMQTWNSKNNPPLPKDEIKRLVYDAVSYQKQKPQTEPTVNKANGETNPTQNIEPDMGFALMLVNSNHVFKCPVDTRELLVYEEGVYNPGECKVHVVLEGEYGETLKKHFLDEVTGHLERSNYVEREEINHFVNEVPVQNGLFNFVTRKVEGFSPDKIFTYKLNVDYDPEKECPKFSKFVEEIMPDENDRLLLQEIMGYCLVPAMPLHKLFWFYGLGRNGKDRIILTLEYILGKESCASLNLCDLSEARRFSLCQLYGKLLNVSSEPDTKYPITTNILKLISGENTIHAELKGKNKRLRFTNTAKPIVVGNYFPKVNDSSIGFWDRVVVLNFPMTFIGEDCKPNIERSWLDSPDEISGVFNWMLEGAYRLKENGEFTKSKTTEETKLEFMKVSAPFNAWIMECCKFVPEAYLTRDESYDSYKIYCDELGATPDSARGFYAKMRATPRVKDTKIKVNNKAERVFQGIAFKSTEEPDQQQVLDTNPDDPVSSNINETEFSEGK